MSIINRVLLFSVCFCGLAHALQQPTSRHQKPDDKPTVIFSTDEMGKNQQDRFPCGGRVYAHITFPDSFIGEHVLEARWFKPDGSMQEQTKLSVGFEGSHPKIASVWLNFQNSPKNIFDDFVMGGKYGKSGRNFNGLWRLKVYENAVFLLESSFYIECE